MMVPSVRSRFGEVRDGLAAVERDDCGTLFAEMLAELPTNTAGRASDGDDFVLERHDRPPNTASASAIQARLLRRK